MKTDFTPGPWEVGYASAENLERSTLAVWPKNDLDNGFGTAICKVSPAIAINETDKSNARLIAAAPELLEALQMVCDSGVAISDEITKKIISAIAKATSKKEGEQ